MLTGKKILITGGTGSLGKVLIRRLLSGEFGTPDKIIVFSRDEAKQHNLRLEYLHKTVSTEEIVYHNFERILEFVIGDVRDYASIANVLRDVDIVFNAAAMKQVPTCEYFPYEAVRTNIDGCQNIIRAIRELRLPVETVVGISTDKAAKPVNVMGMTKSLQERLFLSANIYSPQTRFVCVRYGNVLASRGSVIPLFHDQIKKGGPVTVTSPDMTRFLLSLDEAVDVIMAAVKDGDPGDTFVPRVPSSNIMTLARGLIEDREIEIKVTGIRPGEKLHEILISEEESMRTVERGNYYVIQSILPELRKTEASEPCLTKEYSSEDDVMTQEEMRQLLSKRKLRITDMLNYEGEFLA